MDDILESYIKEHAIKLGTNEKRATEIYELWKNKL